MSETMWTPGVWSSDPREIAGEGWAVSSDHTFVNSNGGTWREYVAQFIKNKETANLLAAAKELFLALDQIVDDMGDDGLSCCQAAKDQAKAALAKARGDCIG